MKNMLALLAVLSAGCAVPRPMLFKASMAPPEHSIPDPAAYHKAAVRAALQRYYPQLVKNGDTGVETVFLVTTTSGVVERTDLIRGEPKGGPSTEALFRRFTDLRDDPARIGAGVTRFEAGELGPDRIYVVWAEREVPGAARGPVRLTMRPTQRGSASR